MEPLLIVNDLHLGVNRAAGTTLKSAFELRLDLLTSFSDLLDQHLDKSIVINGDAFDDYLIPLADVMEFYSICVDWLNRATSAGARLFIAAGNHDLSKNSANIGALELVTHMLVSAYPSKVAPFIKEPTLIRGGVLVIPHLANQDLLDRALAEVDPTFKGSILLHANFANNFAVHSDHSLNVSRTQAKKLIEQGCQLIFGHEHQRRTAFAGSLVVTGNQFPSSIADCLNAEGQEDGKKYAHVLYDDGRLEKVETWDAVQEYTELTWDSIDLYDEPYQFVRVVGRATAEQAADVIQKIAKLRQRSDAYVITNAVSIEGMADETSLPESLELAKAFDVLAFLYEQLTEEEQATVTQLMENSSKK